MKRVLCRDVETAGVLQSEIDREGLGDQLKAERHSWAPAGMIIVEGGGGPQFFTETEVMRSYAGVRLLLLT